MDAQEKQAHREVFTGMDGQQAGPAVSNNSLLCELGGTLSLSEYMGLSMEKAPARLSLNSTGLPWSLPFHISESRGCEENGEARGRIENPNPDLWQLSKSK